MKARAAAALPLLVWLLIYLPDAGRGFIKDDFAWLLAAPLAASPWDAAWTASTGFFRPLVSLSFTVNHALFGLDAFGYGLTNLGLALACGVFIGLLARACGLGTRGAIIAALLWLFTPHGMDMAVIWISGRVTLLLVLFATAACWSAARGRLVPAAIFLVAALLSKEEAVVVPVLASLAMAAGGHGRNRRMLVSWAVVSAAILAVYFSMRAGSGAMTPWSAPDEYRYALAVLPLLENAWQYIDRLVTFPLLACAVVWLTTRGTTGASYRTDVAAMGVAWAAVAMIPTFALPVRSSLYVLPALVGTSLCAASLIEARLAAAGPRRLRHAAVALLIMLIAAVPIYRSRHREWSGAARLSARVTADAAIALRDVPAGATVVVRDRRDQPNLESTFGTLLPEMLKVTTGRDFQLVIPQERESLISFAPVSR